MLVVVAGRTSARFTPTLSEFALKASAGALGASNRRYSMPEPGIQACYVDVEPVTWRRLPEIRAGLLPHNYQFRMSGARPHSDAIADMQRQQMFFARMTIACGRRTLPVSQFIGPCSFADRLRCARID